VPTYSWLTKSAAIAALQGRLNNSSFWTATELQTYIYEGLKHFNGLCEIWNAPLLVTQANGQWINTGTQTGSPRLRSVTDVDLYTQMEYMLLEPASGGAWTGSSQFTLQNLQWSLQKRVQEVIQQTSCNLGLLGNINAMPGVRNGYALPDTVLDPRRNRFFALLASTTGTASSGAYQINIASTLGVANGQVISGTGIQAGTFVTGISGLVVTLSLPTSGAVSGTVQFFQPFLLTREDVLSFQSFEPGYLQTVGYPQSWAIASEPPLSFDVDLAPNTPGYFEMLALNAGPTFDPPTPSLLGIPDDWAWLPMYGALADVLGQEAESTDRARAAYCLQRYTEGLEMMKQSNWLLQALINGQSSKTTALADMDALAVNWQCSTWNLPAVIEAGMDFIAPVPGNGASLAVTLVQNAPIVDATGTYLQVARDDFDAVLNYAHHIAAFKMGGKEFQDTMPMLTTFYQYCADRNRRWATAGVFVPYLRSEGKKQEIAQPRIPPTYDQGQIQLDNFFNSLSSGRRG
jgi:hypothetical protein